jgi:hypothetical protein
MKEFLKDFYDRGNRSVEVHPFVSTGSCITNADDRPITLNNEPVINESWRPFVPLENQWVINEHFFGYLPTFATRDLFIGTFPPTSVTFGYDQNIPFFYGSADNLLWRIMPFICTDPNAIGINFFDSFNIGITDVLWRVERTKFGGADDGLEPLQYNKLDLLLDAYPQINNLYFTSEGNTKSAFARTYEVLKIRFPDLPRKNIIKENKQIPANFFGRVININFLYSPSDYATMQIYNQNKFSFYSALANYYGIEFEGRRNKILAGLIAPQLDNVEIQWVYRIFQWSKCLRNVPNLIRPNFCRILDEIGFV